MMSLATNFSSNFYRNRIQITMFKKRINSLKKARKKHRTATLVYDLLTKEINQASYMLQEFENKRRIMLS